MHYAFGSPLNWTAYMFLGQGRDLTNALYGLTITPGAGTATLTGTLTPGVGGLSMLAGHKILIEVTSTDSAGDTKTEEYIITV